MRTIYRSMAVGGLVPLVSVGLLAQPAVALHEGAIADCGTTGTFTLHGTPNNAGFQSPPVNSVLQFEGGGTLSIISASEDGVLVWDPAVVGRASNALEEVTCTFTLANGVELEITGIYTPGP